MFAPLRSGFKPREARRPVLIQARMRTGAVWMDVVLHNLSSRGALVAADPPPRPGSYIEIRRGTRVIIARVVWRDGRFFGVRAQDRIDIGGLVNEPRLAQRPSSVSATEGAETERRARTRLAAEAEAARQLERSRRLSSVIQFGIFIAGGLCVAGTAAMLVHDLLSHSMAAIEHKL